MASSGGWSHEYAERDGVEWRMDSYKGQLVRVMLRPVGTDHWLTPFEWFRLRVAA